MNTKPLCRFGCVAVLWLCYHTPSAAREAIPCLIFSGSAETENCLDLAKFNRITFEYDGMTVSSSKIDGVQEAFFAYSLYNHLEIGDRIPNDFSGVDGVFGDENAKLLYCSDTRSLIVESSADNPYGIRVFNLTGAVIASSTVYPGESMSVNALSPGIYIAVATDGKIKSTLKFIIN